MCAFQTGDWDVASDIIYSYRLILFVRDVKKWKIVLSYGMLQEGSADLEKISTLAFDYLIKGGNIKSD